MPFTLAHPAAVLPLRKAKRLPLAALVVGSVTPDLEYLVHLRPGGSFLHSPLGLLVDVPLAAALAWFVDRVVLPRLRRRVGLPPRASTLTSMPWTLAACAIGIATHIVWDSFTHPTGFSVRAIPELSDPVIGDLPMFQLLQYVCSIVGLALIGVIAARAIARYPAVARVSVLKLAAASGAVGVLAGAANALRANYFQQEVAYFAVGCLVGLALALLATAARADPGSE